MYGGTKEEMERLLADAEKLSGVHYDISSFSDIANAIHVVQQEMGIAGTTAAEAAGTIEGSALSAKAAWENLITGLADEKADLTTLTANFVDSAKTALANMMPRLQQILASMGELITGLAPVIGEEIPKLIAEVLPSLIEAGIKLIGGIVSGISTALPQLMSAALDIMIMLGEAIAEYIPVAIASIPDIIVGIVDFLTENFPKLLDAGFALLIKIGEGLILAVPELLASIPSIIAALLEAFGALATGALDIGKDIVKGIWDGITSMLQWIVDKVRGFIDTIIGTAKDALSGLIGGNPSSGYSENLSGGGTYTARALPTYDLSGIDNIPRLAKGAVISPNSEFLAILGDQRNGTNIEAPLSTITEAIQDALGDFGGSGEMIVNVNFTGTLSQLVRALKPQIQVETRRLGPNLLGV